jgi:hypothetical protein
MGHNTSLFVWVISTQSSKVDVGWVAAMEVLVDQDELAVFQNL